MADVSATDPITAEVVRNFLDAVAEETYTMLHRTSQSPTVNEGKDCAAGIYAYDGVVASLVSRAGNILHSFSTLASAQTCLEFFRGDLDPGDVLLIADSHHGGSHIGDYTVLLPIFFDGRPKFFAAMRLHVADQGGPAQGAVNPVCEEIWHEGFRPGPLKLFEKGQRRRELWNWLKRNNRLPDLLEADLEAMIGACRVGERRIRELCDRYGLEVVGKSLDWIFDYSERKFRDQVAAWSDGTYSADFYVDNDFANHQDLKIRVSITIMGDQIAFDFTGTSPQTDGAINSVAANTTSWICIVLSVVCPTIPVNTGLFRSLVIDLPERSLVDARPPAATLGSTVVCGAQIGQAVMKAVEQFAPESVGNPSIDLASYWAVGSDERPERFQRLSTTDAKMYMFVDMTTTAVSNSGTYGVDGWGCWAMPHSVASPVNYEISELQAPVFFHESEYATDSAAPGQWRGSPAYATRRSLPQTSNTMAVFMWQSLVHPLCGYAGGYEGTGNLAVVDEGGEHETICQGTEAIPVSDSAIIFTQCGGGGGWGDPLDRDPHQVLDDVLDDYVSIEGARIDYGVVIDPGGLTVLEDETTRERAARKADTARHRRGIGREWVIRRAGIEDRVRPGT